MSRMSREKGKRGERDWRDQLRLHGFDARRGQQFSGSPDSPDVICEALAVHWEVKRQERANLFAAYEQAATDAAIDKEPVVATRRNASPWMIFCSAGHYLGLHQKISRLETELKEARRKDE